MKSGWQQDGQEWRLNDLSSVIDAGLVNDRSLPGYWQVAEYTAVPSPPADGEAGFSGKVLFANPSQNAPEIRLTLPVTGRYSIAVGMIQNYSDRLLLKMESEPCFSKLSHSPVAPSNTSIEECWWRDVDLVAGDVLVLKQDTLMKRRCNIALVRLYPALPATLPEIPVLTTVDGLPGNHGPVDLDEMLNEELIFADTHVSDILHGTDINGAAQYMTKMPHHRLPVERAAEEVHTDDEYYPWSVEQLLKYQREGRCPLRDSIGAAHSIDRKIYAYYRMAVTRLFAPMRGLFQDPMFDRHPEWRCIDFDGTPISRLSIACAGVREYMLEHFQETVEFGADGVCLVFSRGWPLVLFEAPVAEDFKARTGKDMKSVQPDDPELRQVRADFITNFLRDIRQTVIKAGNGRPMKVVALVLATPEINRHFGMDCDVWAKEGLVDTLVPYPYGLTAVPTPIEIQDWLKVTRATAVQLIPILNRMTYEPAGIFETPLGLLDRAEQWLNAGVDGFSFWDLDGFISLPAFRRMAYNLGSREGRTRLRQIVQAGQTKYDLKTLDGLAVDRYHPGWNV